MERRLTNQDVSWFLDLSRNDQLDLDPSYQRRSVWTRKDRQAFLDTIFRGFPCPAIFLHKTISEDGKQAYHVVDGKQRLETVLKFVANEISIAKDFGDAALNGKRWANLEGSPDLKRAFWNYVFSVEFIDVAEGSVVNDVFDRLNRNARKLERQEIRHARYDGWLIRTAEYQAENRLEWDKLGVVTNARSRRMKDVQFISELLILLLKNRIDGFDQDFLDATYAEYDDVGELASFSEEQFSDKLGKTLKYATDMEASNNCVTTYARGFGDCYSLWSLIVLNKDKLPDPASAASKYSDFMSRVKRLEQEKDPEAFSKTKGDAYANAFAYFRNSLGASTDAPQRQARHKALVSEICQG